MKKCLCLSSKCACIYVQLCLHLCAQLCLHLCVQLNVRDCARACLYEKLNYVDVHDLLARVLVQMRRTYLNGCGCGCVCIFNFLRACVPEYISTYLSSFQHLTKTKHHTSVMSRFQFYARKHHLEGKKNK